MKFFAFCPDVSATPGRLVAAVKTPINVADHGSGGGRGDQGSAPDIVSLSLRHGAPSLLRPGQFIHAQARRVLPRTSGAAIIAAQHLPTWK